MSYGGHLSYRLVYNNLSNAAHNTMRPLKSKGVHCIKIRVISQRQVAAPKTRTSFSWGALFFVPAFGAGIFFVNASQMDITRTPAFSKAALP